MSEKWQDNPAPTRLTRIKFPVAGGAAAAAIFALLLAACGGAGGAKVSSSATKPAATQPPAPAPAVTPAPTTAAPSLAASSAPSVVLIANPKLGSILATAQDMVLYTYTADNPGGAGCTGTCLKYWPPFLLPAGAKTAIGGPGVTGLGTVARPEGTQVTYQTKPLYTFIGDLRPGEANGQGVVDGGGTWFAVVITPPAASPAPATANTTPVPATIPPAEKPATTSNTVPAPAPMPVETTPRTTTNTMHTPATMPAETPHTTPPTTARSTTVTGGGVSY